MKLTYSRILKLSLFATGLAGIVAEYTLSTLATYFLGDSIFQWTMIVSFMLFSMGLGSNFSKYIKKNLIESFVFIELILSLLASFSTIFCYYISAYSNAPELFIYLLSMLIGMLIGLEIPLVIRLNESYEKLQFNVANVMEKDYYGSLLGGILFAFVAVPILGLSYTPFIFAGINLVVALLVFFRFQSFFGDGKWLSRLRISIVLTISIFAVGLSFTKPIIRFSEQSTYRDKIIYEERSKYQKIVITQWQNDYWLFINGNQQLSTLDEYMYHEPLVHPLMQIHPRPRDILVLGGGDGAAVREILKYDIQQIDLVDLDPAMTELGKTHPVLLELNKNALNDPRVHIKNEDGFIYLSKTKQFYDIIIIDLPDPKTIELSRLYSLEFYQMLKHHLRENGMMITQAGSPYYATKAFNCVIKTVEAAGLRSVPIHNQVLSLGEWGWVIALKTLSKDRFKEKLDQLDYHSMNTRFLNKEVNKALYSFGKNFILDSAAVEVNRLTNPILYRYYLDGNWNLY